MNITAIAKATGGFQVTAGDGEDRFIETMLRKYSERGSDEMKVNKQRIAVYTAILKIIPKFAGKKVLKPLVEAVNAEITKAGVDAWVDIRADHYTKTKELVITGRGDARNVGRSFGNLFDDAGGFNAKGLAARIEKMCDDAQKVINKAGSASSIADRTQALKEFYAAAEYAAHTCGVNVDAFLYNLR